MREQIVNKKIKIAKNYLLWDGHNVGHNLFSGLEHLSVFLRHNRRPVDLFRVGVALVSLTTILFTPLDILFYSTTTGQNPAQCRQIAEHISLYCISDSETWPFGARWIHVLVLLLVISGLVPQFATVLHWWVSWSFSVNSNVVDGGDQLLANLLFLCIIISFNDYRKMAWSSRRTGGPDNVTINAISISGYILFVGQIAGVYAQSTIAKLGVDEWRDGSAIWYWFQSSLVGPAESNWMAQLVQPLIGNPLGSTLVTYTTLLIQAFLFLALFLGPFPRRCAFIVGTIFHISIAVILGLWSFSLVMILAELVVYIRAGDGLAVANLKSTERRNLHDSKNLEFIGEGFDVAEKSETESANKSHAIDV